MNIEQEYTYWDHRVGRLRDRINRFYFELGIALSKIQDNGFYSRFGYKDIIEYAQERYDISPRKTMGLIAIGKKYSALRGFQANHIEGVSWTKALKLIPVVTENNYQEWLDKAKTLSGNDLANAILLSQGRASRTTRRIAFTVYMDEYQTIEEALEIAQKLTGSDRKGSQFAAVAQEFLSSYPYLSKRELCLQNNEIGGTNP